VKADERLSNSMTVPMPKNRSPLSNFRPYYAPDISKQIK
jgi:hypothetical protein